MEPKYSMFTIMKQEECIFALATPWGESAIGAISVGINHGYKMLDLCYDEDSNAEIDFNVVMTSDGEFVEVQGTAEGKPFTKEDTDSLLSLAEKGIRELFEIQQEALKAPRNR